MYVTVSVFPSGCILAHKNFLREARDVFSQVINNGNRTEWSPIRSVIILVINHGRPIAITEQSGRHKVLLLINHNHFKICDILSFYEIKTQAIPRVFCYKWN